MKRMKVLSASVTKMIGPFLALAISVVFLPASAFALAAGGAYLGLDNFPPGVYEAVRAAKVYSDLDNKAVEKGLLIKKGTRINVYSAGHSMDKAASTEWFNLSEATECNGKVLPWEKFAWLGVKSKDFKRVADLEAPSRQNGIVTNCGSVKGGQPKVQGGTKLTIPAKPDQTKSDTKKKPILYSGVLQFGHNEAGGFYGIKAGKKLVTIVYVGALDEPTESQLQRLADSKTKVQVKGTLEVWKDGSSTFYDGAPVDISW